MKMIYEAKESEDKLELECTLETISDQVQLIEQRYSVRIKDGISKGIQDHRKEINKIRTMINIIQLKC